MYTLWIFIKLKVSQQQQVSRVIPRELRVILLLVYQQNLYTNNLNMHIFSLSYQQIKAFKVATISFEIYFG